MSLRLSMVLLIVLSYASIGAAVLIRTGGEEEDRNDPPFFYTVADQDLRNIKIETGGKAASWSLRDGTNRWYFDDMKDVPTDLFRWGGITVLLGGPQTQRVLSSEIEDPASYGLDDPDTRITLTLRDGSTRSLVLGNLTPNGEANYARMEGYPQLVSVSSSWGDVLERLVNEPPLPKWHYTMDPQKTHEVLLFIDNEVIRGYGFNSDEGKWYVCDLPATADPCTGTQPADGEAIVAAMTHFGQPAIDGAEALNLSEPSEYLPYEASPDAPYIAVRVENVLDNGVTEVTRTTMTIGGVTPDGNFRYAVANETSDIIRVDRAWADQVLELFHGEVLAAEG